MKWQLLNLAAVLAVLGAALAPSRAMAAKGTPTSPDFGYGAWIDLQANYADIALQAAADQRLDWIALSFDWAARWPDPSQPPSIVDIDQTMEFARQNRLAVLLSLEHAPSWAQTGGGPSRDLAAWLVASFASRYPQALQAVELFPGANRASDWGAAPDPVAYMRLFAQVQTTLQQAGSPVNMVAGGLVPLDGERQSGDLDDLVYLQRLYEAGAGPRVTILSIRLPELAGSPLQLPGPGEHRVLRHYEEIRRVMLANRHAGGILWVTTFQSPSGRIQANDAAYNQPDQQAQWYAQAYRQLRAQLYVGAVFYPALNPTRDHNPTSLIRNDGSHHPFYDSFWKLIAQNNARQDAAGESTEPQIKRIVKSRS